MRFSNFLNLVVLAMLLLSTAACRSDEMAGAEVKGASGTSQEPCLQEFDATGKPIGCTMNPPKHDVPTAPCPEEFDAAGKPIGCATNPPKHDLPAAPCPEEFDATGKLIGCATNPPKHDVPTAPCLEEFDATGRLIGCAMNPPKHDIPTALRPEEIDACRDPASSPGVCPRGTLRKSVNQPKS